MTQLLEESDFRTVRDLYDSLARAGISISYPTLITYKKFDVVPPFSKAKQILQEFNYQISDESLNEILEYSQSELRKIKQSRKYWQRGLRINPRHIEKEMTVDRLEQRISERAEVLFGDKATFNMYLEFLIKKDLEEEEKG